MIRRNIGKRIRKYRKFANLSQLEVSKALKVSRPTITAWETDRNEPSINDIQKMAEMFGCKVSDLVPEPDAAFNDPLIKDFAQFLFDNAPDDAEYFKRLKAVALALIN